MQIQQNLDSAKQ